MRGVDIQKGLLQNLYINHKLTTYQIAEKLGFCQGTIWNKLKKYNIKTRLSYVPVDLTKKQLRNCYIKEKLSTWEIQKKFGYPRSTAHGKLKEFGLNTRNIAVSHIRFLRHNFNGDILEKAYLIGFRIGDLNITKRGNLSETVVVKCASTKEGQLKLFKNLFSKYGHIWQGKPDIEGRINIQANLNSTFSFLLSKTARSYNWVFENDTTFLAFLAGFFDAEGSFFISKGKSFFSIGNYDKILLFKIKRYLQRLEIETPKIGIYFKKNRKIYRGYLSKKDYYTLSCSKKTNLLKLVGLLKPYLKHPDKTKKATLIKQNIIKRNLKSNRLGF